MLHSFRNHCIFTSDKPDLSQLRIDTYTSINQLPPAWDTLLPESNQLKSMSLKINEAARIEDMEFRYLLITKSSEVIGCIYLQILHFNNKHYNPSLFSSSQVYLIRQMLKAIRNPMVVCGNLFRANFKGFYFRDKSHEKLLFDILNQYCSGQPDCQSYVGILVKDYPEAASQQIQSARFKTYNDDSTMRLNIRSEWHSFEDYMASLSRKYLQRAKKIIQASAVMERRELTLEALMENAEQIDKLYKQVADKQSIRMGILNSNYFIEMYKCYQNRYKVVGYYYDNKLVAFTSYIYIDEMIEVNYIGFDYELNHTLKLYFNILFDAVKEAIGGGYKIVELGRTAREAKASLGAVSVSQTNFVKLKTGLPSVIFHFFNKYYTADVDDLFKQRNPFKELALQGS